MPKMVSDDEREELQAMPLDASVYGESFVESPHSQATLLLIAGEHPKVVSERSWTRQHSYKDGYV